jgi:hypothetical protein
MMDASNWKQTTIKRLNGKKEALAIPVLSQIATERMNRPVAVPYLVFMPEKKRLLMLVTCDYPHRPMLMSSDDGGDTWTEPQSVFQKPDDPKHLVGVGLTYLGKGKLVFCTEEDGRYFSEDYGRTWSDPIPKPPISNGKAWCQWDPFMVDIHPQTQEVLRVWETGWNFIGEAYLPDGRLGVIQAYLRSSTDLGKTWTKEIAVPAWHGSCEVALIRAANGDMIAACRTEAPEELNKPIPEVDHFTGLGVSISTDNGQTWSKVQSLYTWGRHHPSMVLQPDGRIVMSYVVRKGYEDTAEGFPQFGIEAVVSSDHGRTWDLEHRYILAAWQGNRKEENKWWASSQATSSILLPDGSILTAYGTGYRSMPNEKGMPSPRDVGLVKWKA